MAGLAARGRPAGRAAKANAAPQAPPRPPAVFRPPDSEGARFLADRESLVAGIRGPFGSGKSVLCVHKLLKHAQEMRPYEILGADGKVIDRVRRSRWSIVRNTFPELKLTTVKTWRDWVPDSLGEFSWTPPYQHFLNYRMPDGTRVEAEFIFLALDRPADIRKVLSLDVTGGWINEAREVGKEIVDGLTARLGRFPSPEHGGCPDEHKILIMDTNSPPEEHWWPVMAGDVDSPDWLSADDRRLLVKPADWTFYTQPPAMLEVTDETGRVAGYEINPARANQALPPSYYTDMIAGKTRTWINVYVLNRYDTIVSGHRVHAEWSDELHLAPKAFGPDPRHAIHIGLDFGRTPAAVFLQYADRRCFVFHELVLSGVSTRTFGRMLAHEIARHGWQDHAIRLHGDPSGDDLKETADEAPSEIIRAATKMVVHAAPTNDPLVRIEAISLLLTETTGEGPCMTVSPSCHVLIAGFRGGYHYKQLGQRSGTTYDSKPAKNRFSHPQDALQYGAMGAGAWQPVLNGGRPGKATVAQRVGTVMSRYAAARSTSRWSRHRQARW